MIILGLIQKNSGPSFHRVEVPLLLMKEADGEILEYNGQKLALDYKPDVVVYNRHTGDTILQFARKVGAKVVCDIDDYWKLDPHHIAYEAYKKTGFEKTQLHHIRQADAVTVTHDRLAEVVYPYNKNVHILPNAIPNYPDYFPTTKMREATQTTKLFWQGSVTHERDIRILKPVMQQLGPEYMMVMAGVSEDAAWGNMVNDYTDGMRLPAALLPGEEPRKYYNYYRYADICLVPLLDTPFNRHKSNLKVLEAAHMGLPVIASKVHPYLQMPLLYSRKTEDWLRWIKDTDAQKEQAIKLQAYCQLHHHFETINAQRRDIYATK